MVFSGTLSGRADCIYGWHSPPQRERVQMESDRLLPWDQLTILLVVAMETRRADS